MQHEARRVPVTALALFRHDVILAGEGNYLKAYGADFTLLKTARIFESQAIHGIIVGDDEASIFVWGGPFSRSLKFETPNDGESHNCALRGLNCITDDPDDTGDWILDAAYAPLATGRPTLCALVTAHNALWVAESPKASSTSTVLERVVPGSNCLLYSAHVLWLSSSRCLIASGTAFGDIVIWSATVGQDSGTFHAAMQTHYTFAAHEGSIFGVQLSRPTTLPSSNSTTRVLSSCSDDRVIKLWDVSNADTASSTLPQVQRDTGFGSTPGAADPHAPPCIAKVMGHVSRVWSARYIYGPPVNLGDVHECSLRGVVSFGEDATVIHWTLQSNVSEEPASPPYMLQRASGTTAHSGKNLWSVAIDNSGRLATGGADGAIALHSSTNHSTDTFEVPGALLHQYSPGESYKAYCFIDTDKLLATTDHGRLVVVDLSCTNATSTVHGVSAPLSGLRGYSIVTGVPWLAFVAGNDGSVYAYFHKAQHLQTVLDGSRKTAGLFACSVSSRDIALLVTTVRTTSAQLLHVLLKKEHDSSELLRPEAEDVELPVGFIVTSFAFHVSNGTNLLAIGSRCGSIAIYRQSREGQSAPVLLLRLCTLVHGKDAVTALLWKHGDSRGGVQDSVYSTGHDGTFAVHSVTISEAGCEIALVHQLSLPFGPNIEGLRLEDGLNVQAWGFRSKHFVQYDMTALREVMTVECGGAHRNWAFQPHGSGGTVVWTKASKMYVRKQSALPYKLGNSGCHGREIKVVAASNVRPRSHTAGESEAHSTLQLIATGAEDTDIKLFRIERGGFRCLHTLRKHNTGIQHLQWSSDDRYLFSSGGCEEFFVWRITHDVPEIGVGVACESTHPRNGSSDLRIMAFDVRDGVRRDQAPATFDIAMAYSDSTLKLWRYSSKQWQLLVSADYLTACLTSAIFSREDTSAIVTTAFDGHVVIWAFDEPTRTLEWLKRQKIHQNAIHVVSDRKLSDGSAIFLTGGDDNAIGLTRTGSDGHTRTLLIPRAHAAAVTGLAILPIDDKGDAYYVVSASIDQRVKLWEVTIDVTQPGADGLNVRRLQSVSTAVADVSSLVACRREDGELAVLVCGVGMELWSLPLTQGADGRLKVLVNTRSQASE